MPDVLRHGTVDGIEEFGKSVAFNVDVVVGSHEPLVVVDEVVVHVFEHEERFLLWGVGVVDVVQSDDVGVADVDAAGVGAGEVGDATVDGRRPRLVRRLHSRAEVFLRRHDADEEASAAAGWRSGVSAP